MVLVMNLCPCLRCAREMQNVKVLIFLSGTKNVPSQVLIFSRARVGRMISRRDIDHLILDIRQCVQTRSVVF